MNRRTILLVEDNPLSRKLVRVTLELEGYRVLESADAHGALELAASGSPDLVLQDIVLPDLDGFALRDALRQLPGGETLPILAVTGLAGIEDRPSASSFDQILYKPLDTTELLLAVRRYLPTAERPEAQAQGKHVLLVDDDPVQRKLARVHLEQRGFRVSCAGDGVEALALALGEHPPDAILSDVLMPRLDGFQLCHAVRLDPRLAHIPILLASANYVAPEDDRLARSLGAHGLVTRGPDLDPVLDVLVRAMVAGPTPVTLAPETAHRAHAGRVTAQLEKQSAANAALRDRCALQGATFGIIARIAAKLATQVDIVGAFDEVLYAIVDACGLGEGALFLGEGDDLSLVASCGATTEQGWRQIQGAPGCPSLALRSCACAAATCVPVIGSGKRLGTLMLGPAERPLDERSWLAFARTIGLHLGQAIAMSQAYASAVAAERRAQVLVEHAADGIFILSPEGVIRQANRRAEEIHGLSRAEMVGRHFSELVDPAHSSTPLAQFQRLLDEGHVLADGVVLRRGDGTQAIVDFSAQLVDLGGERAVLSIAHDATERTAATRALAASEARYRALLGSIPAAVWIGDSSGRALFMSEKIEPLLGITPEEACAGDAGMWLERAHPDDRARLEVAFATLLTASEPVDLECRFQHRDGRWRWLHSRAVRTLRPDGEHQLEGVTTDVTERVTAEQALRERDEQLQHVQKMEAVGQLTGGVAHDFNNLLGVILANASFLVEELPAPDPRRADVEDILDAATRGTALVRQLMAFSRHQVLQPKRIDLNAVVTGMGTMLRRLVPESIALEIAVAPAPCRLHADPGQLEQVLMNLVVNASQAIGAAPGRLSIETSSVVLGGEYVETHLPVTPGRYVVLTVSDSGCGMDAETRRRAFEPFFTTKGPGLGTGLGLATCYGIVQQSGGHLWLYSEPGMGTVVKAYLPEVEGPVGERSSSSPAGCVGGSETVLLVEDDARLRAANLRALERHGYRVLCACDGAEALALAERNRGIDLILSDVVMPGVGGPELADRLRVHQPTARVLLMSGYTDSVLLRQGVLASRLSFLQKPFTPDALCRKVREVLDA